MDGNCYRCDKGPFDCWLGAYEFDSPEAHDDETRTLCVDCYYDFWNEFLS